MFLDSLRIPADLRVGGTKTLGKFNRKHNTHTLTDFLRLGDVPFGDATVLVDGFLDDGSKQLESLHVI